MVYGKHTSPDGEQQIKYLVCLPQRQSVKETCAFNNHRNAVELKDMVGTGQPAHTHTQHGLSHTSTHAHMHIQYQMKANIQSALLH